MSNAPFVSPQWLAAHLADPGLVVIDGSWYLPAMNRDPQAEYRAGHIPGAVRFDIDAVKDRASSLPHMLPVGRTIRRGSRRAWHRVGHEDRRL